MVIDSTNLTAIETDGPYGGYTCGSNDHKWHKDESDSVFWQNKLQGEFYGALREREIYVNQPDLYFFQGGSKTGKLHSSKAH